MSTTRLFVVLVPAVSILAIMGFIIVSLKVPSTLLTRDVSAIAGLHPLTGMLSSMGILLWCVSGAVCAFSTILLRPAKFSSPESISIFQYLMCSAILSSYLMFDDLFLFHENLASEYFGINEKVIFIFLGGYVFLYLISFRKIILKTNIFYLFLALSFLAISVLIDSVFEPYLSRFGHWEYFIEDGFKWLGIVFWCSYFVETCFKFVTESKRMEKGE